MFCCPPVAERQEPAAPTRSPPASPPLAPKARRRSPWQAIVATLREPAFALLFAASLLHFAFGDPTQAGLLLGLCLLSAAIAVALKMRDTAPHDQPGNDTEM
ncbi:hypothetical protein D3874_18710 [Oleomonas cavernae]|uniref:Uncharacterized protein n=1 Tax=Oleomonas cavernae TaxID=2320859 RepID=A0A418WFL4_9PROT|nr:hypothetical protein [Oleomonas cavernae]RJF88770.1 hypothetical protein D3874_18710 [Oleomonas cavernae]